MRTFRSFIVYAVILFTTSCKQDEDPPDLAAISENFCSIKLMCDAANFEVAFGDSEGCRADILMDFEEAKEISDECFDATVAHLSCVGAYSSCEEYDMRSIECDHKSSDYVYLCLGGL